MSTPYWGQLPGPKIVNKNLNIDGRLSDDERRSSLDTPAAINSKTNRSSIHTQVTDAPTETTFSPSYDSPTIASFAHGLAPPSYQRPQSLEDSTLKSSRLRPIEYENAPQDHSVSHRRYGDGSLPYTQTSSGTDKAAQQAPDFSSSISMEFHEHHKYNAPRQRVHGDTGMADPSRRASATASERRRKSALHKSPLQRLELTLDSMTKEEKRARVEAAERRARERQASGSGEGLKSQQNQPTQPHNREPPTEAVATQTPIIREGPYHREAPVSREGPLPKLPHVAREGPIQRDPYLSKEDVHKNPRDVREPHGYREPPGGIPERRESLAARVPQQRQHYEDRPFTAVPQHQTRVTPAHGSEPDLPRRNLSFRERATQNEIGYSNGDEARFTAQQSVHVSAQQPPPTKGIGFSLARSGSNKLKKEPPGDPWYHARREMEQRIPTVSQRTGPNLGLHQPHNATPRDREFSTQPQRTQSYAQRPEQAGDRGPQPHDSDYNVQPVQRRTTEPIHGVQGRRYETGDSYFPSVQQTRTVRYQEPPEILEKGKKDSIYSDQLNMRQVLVPGEGLYKPPVWLEDWKNADVGTLSGPLLNLDEEHLPTIDKNKPWWSEGGRRRSSSFGAGALAAGAFEGEFESPRPRTQFNPPLYLKCGPLLRYCGLRYDRVPTRSRGIIANREIWRGSVMIVTRDSDSSYDIVPTLRLFVQDIELLPRAPHTIDGDLSPEFVDPISGHPKLGRKGETLYVRPVEHLEEGVDLSMDETDTGLFEAVRSPPDVPPADGSPDYPGTFTSRMKRAGVDGEKMQKCKDVRGFRLHTERGCTFWRFNIEIELRDQQQRIAYRVNRGPSMAFWVPARGKAMNIMFHSCNGFGPGVHSDILSGPDPMWRDVLNAHQTSPFHVMIGGGDQIYNDGVVDECDLLLDWLEIKNPAQKQDAPFTSHLQGQLEDFYFQRYCTWFSTSMFGLANSQIPMVNIWSDREAFNGLGAFPIGDTNSPVPSGMGAVAYKYYMLFQHQSIIPETEVTEPSWILGAEPGPCVNEISRSIYLSLGSKLALLAADCRTERTEDDIIHDKTWEKIINRLYDEVKRGQVEHLLVVFPLPIAFPRLDFLENMFTSKLMSPFKGLFGKNDDTAQVVHELKDHWTAKKHQHERSIVIEDLQDLAIDKSLRVTILSGNVNMAAVGQFQSNPKLGLAKHNDPRYMTNIVSSAIANAPPTNLMADTLNKRHKVFHFDKQTDESMIPIFQHGVDGKPRNNKRLLPHRNWCSIRQWEPGHTPPPTPPMSRTPSPPPPTRRGSLLRRLSLSKDRPDMSKESVRGPKPPISSSRNFERSESPPPKVGLFRRLSQSSQRPNTSRGSVHGPRPPISGGGPMVAIDGTSSPPRVGLLRRLSLSSERPNMSRDSVRGPKPPISGGGGLLRKLSRRLSKGKGDFERPDPELRRSMSLDYDDGPKEKRGFFGLGRHRSKRQPDDGGINGQWGAEDEIRRPATRDMTRQWEHENDPRSSHRAVVNGQWDPEPDGRVPINNRWEETDDDEYIEYQSPPLDPHPRPSGLRGGAANDEYSDGDESHFTAAPPRRAQTMGGQPEDEIPPQALRPFHRTPTGLSVKQMKKARQFEVDLEGGLDICLNVEVNARDPTGITVPYRLLVPKLFYEYKSEDDEIPTPTPAEEPVSGFKRLLSFRKKERPVAAEEKDGIDKEGEIDDNMDDVYDEREEAFRAQEEAYQRRKVEEKQGGYQKEHYGGEQAY